MKNAQYDAAIATYQSRLDRYSSEYQTLNRKLGFFGFTRLIFFLTALACVYFYFEANRSEWLIAAFSLFGLFLVFVRIYQRTKDKSDFTDALITINKTEIEFLDGRPSPYEDGDEYVDPHHPYSYDLDLFGKDSLFAFLNRTTTSYGRQHLADTLLDSDIPKIRERQEAIHDLAAKLDFRQHLQAWGSIQSIDPADIEKLRRWMEFPIVFRKPTLYYLLLIFPVSLMLSLALYFSQDNRIYLNLASALFLLNFLLTALFLKKIMKQVSASTAVGKVLEQFEKQLREIEQQDFHSPLLQSLRDQLKRESATASSRIRRLGSLFKYLDFIINPVMSAVLNGLSLFHIHVLFALDKWKIRNDQHVMNWLRVIGEFESLHSFANLSFNNPGFCTPEIATTETLVATQLAHPLIRNKHSVPNDISFQQEKFFVLTGSNMSGKSTFLRTLGINIVLARAGSVVSAKTFSFFPFDLYVSMRITDSLQDSESFFYAELKKLQEIVRHLEQNHQIFVMLDEILRGTNSNDKHTGTIGLVRKLVANKACGIIATHDLTIANLAQEYPSYMGNKRFESAIVNGELVFDYKLMNGVCESLNATFLMKKMGVID